MDQVLELEPARQHQFDLQRHLVAVLVASVEVQHGAPLAVLCPDDTPLLGVHLTLVVALPILHRLLLEARGHHPHKVPLGIIPRPLL